MRIVGALCGGEQIMGRLHLIDEAAGPPAVEEAVEQHTRAHRRRAHEPIRQLDDAGLDGARVKRCGDHMPRRAAADRGDEGRSVLELPVLELLAEKHLRELGIGGVGV